ncbi:MAG TPA: type ISP restriction/modification enzyme [Bacteroidia bacterium]|nr:type ISP restriction/modification enzyme [Bacteroidia bacterium]
MSKQLISQYYTKVEKLIQFSGSRNEETIKSEFANLLNHYAEKKNLLLVREVFVRGTKGKDVRPDGVLKNILRLDYGYWESKDEADVIDDEIDKKIKKGYPVSNILFEDSKQAVLMQGGEIVMRVDMRKPDELDNILSTFINFEKPEARKFTEAIEKFKDDIPTIVETLRKKIDEEGKKNKNFLSVSESFLELCKAEINPEITMADVREMMIQHILTSDIFNKIFDDPEFHRHNNIANELEKLISTLFNHSERRNLLGSIEHYYDAINAAAASVADHHEKQKFLKALYENFYKAYNPKAADRLGVVYTPNEIVDFMIESTNYLLEKHFKRVLWDKNVEILDPATGTGTFICNMIDKCPPQYLPYKYKNELHANDVAILPYYVANLNIEFTFKQKMNYYEEFPNICFVDTLDNTAALAYKGKQHSMFAFSSENSRRISAQNKKKISVIIGNPPYNANQKNENENNKNREYPYIDKRIKDTYIKNSTAQKTKVYDMYARFYRWASDRLEKNGVLALITNRSFIDSRTFDGFRKIVASEFNAIYIVDLGGDVRANPKISGTKHNVFGIQTGVAIMFLVRRDKNFIEAQSAKEFKELKKELSVASEPVVLYKEKVWHSTEGCRIYYLRRPEMETAKEKLEFLRNNKIEELIFDRVVPDEKNNWLNIADTDFESLIPIASKDVKGGRSKSALFELFSLGVVTTRDEWAYDYNEDDLKKKIKYFYDIYNEERVRWKESNKKKKINDFVSRKIKWTSELEHYLTKGIKLTFDKNKIRKALYRPFSKSFTYYDRIFTHRVYQQDHIFPIANAVENLIIGFNGNDSPKPFTVLTFDCLTDLNSLSPAAGGTKCLPLYRYNEKGERTDNITDWGHEQFVNHYKEKKIRKEDIFHYTYAVLHNPAYRKKYELNLKREFPRIPFYDDFWKWAKWGKQLMDLHINYEKAKPYRLEEHIYKVKAEAKKQKEIFSAAKEPEAMYKHQVRLKAKLKADKEAGIIEIDELCLLTGVPKEAWEYKLGNRSALEWILDQYKEKKPSDPTIAEKFNTYRFADYKEHVIDLLKRVCTVSVETVGIVREMEKENNYYLETDEEYNKEYKNNEGDEYEDYEDDEYEDYEEDEYEDYEDNETEERYAERLDELSNESFESEYELEAELDNELVAMQEAYFEAPLKEEHKKRKRRRRSPRERHGKRRRKKSKGLFGKILKAGAGVLGKVAAATPVGSLVKAGADLVTGDFKGMA